MKRTATSYHLGIVAALLLLQFFIRAHQPALQDPYLDEGFHIKRASYAWDFDMNPGRFSHGKLLLYYWLGIFEAAPDIALPTSRLGVALYSLLTGSAIYAIGRRLGSSTVGLLALGFYAILPSAFFYERMAMADPLTAGFAALTAWRSLIFARKPTIREGVVLGILIALGTLTKLTMGALPALPVAAALIYTPWHWKNFPSQVADCLQRYVPPLIVAGVVTALIWSPILIPAYLARNTDDPFLLVDSFNVRSSDKEAPTGQEYIDRLSSLVYQVTTEELWIGVWIAAVLLLIFNRTRRAGLFLIVWLMVILVPPFVAAQLVTLRYFMPAGVPLALLLAMVWHIPHELQRIPFLAAFWNKSRLQQVVRLALVVGFAVWAIWFALPFAQTDLTAPEDLDFSGTNYTEYHSGYLIGDDAVRDAADTINNLNPPEKTIYANWWLCHLFYFYVDREVMCLDHHTPRADLAESLRRDAPPRHGCISGLERLPAVFRDAYGGVFGTCRGIQTPVYQ